LGLADEMIASRRYLSKRGVQGRLKTLYMKLDIEHDCISLSPFGQKSKRSLAGGSYCSSEGADKPG